MYPLSWSVALCASWIIVWRNSLPPSLSPLVCLEGSGDGKIEIYVGVVFFSAPVTARHQDCKPSFATVTGSGDTHMTQPKKYGRKLK